MWGDGREVSGEDGREVSGEDGGRGWEGGRCRCGEDKR